MFLSNIKLRLGALACKIFSRKGAKARLFGRIKMNQLFFVLSDNLDFFKLMII